MKTWLCCLLVHVTCLALLGCQHANGEANAVAELETAACASQDFLRGNGYLDEAPTLRRERIQLELWDRVTYEKQGRIDWDSLLASRRGRFAGKLRGVKKDREDYVVVYRSEKDFACVRVSSDLKSIHVSEAPCKPAARTLLSIQEGDLVCGRG